MCSYTNIRAVDTIYQCVLTLSLHTTYTSSYYASTQVFGTLNIRWDQNIKNLTVQKCLTGSVPLCKCDVDFKNHI